MQDSFTRFISDSKVEHFLCSHSARAEEERCIRVLKEELDELLKYQHCHHESIEDQKRMLATQHARLKELTHKMVSITYYARSIYFLTFLM